MENLDAGRGEEVTSMTGGFDPEGEDFKRVQQDAESFSIVLAQLLHSPETRKQSMSILEASKEPFDTVPEAMNKINDMAVQMAKEAGEEIGQDVQLAASVFLFNDLVDLGEAAGLFEVPEEEIPELYQDALQIHMEEGIKNGSIDPIQLQLDMEELLTEQQKAGGMGLAEFSGTPQELTEQQMTQSYADKEVKNSQAMALDKSTKEDAQKMGSVQQGPVQQAQGQPNVPAMPEGGM